MIGYIKLNNANFFYEITGKGSPLVFLHGFSLDSRIWNPQFDFFSKRYQVLRYDLRGFGKSDLPIDQDYSHIFDLKAILDTLHLSKICLVGLSLGGSIATQFTINFPEYVNSLVLVDSDLDGFRKEMRVGLYEKKLCITEAKKIWLSDPLLKYALLNSNSRELLLEIVNNYSGWHWVNKDKSINTYPKSINRLNLICCPTLIIIGQYDIPDYHRISEVFHKNIKSSEMIIINNAGHLSNIEMPLTFNDYLYKFLESNQE